MKKYLLSSVALFICLFLTACNNPLQHLGGTNPFSATKQRIDFNLSASDSSWNVVHKTLDSKKNIVITMMPVGQNLSQWKEGIRTTTILFKNKPNETAQSFVQNEMMRAKKYCSRADGNIISENAEFTSYQLTIANCTGGYPDQTMFGKAFNGSDGVYAARYSAKVNQVPDSEVHAMAQVIRNAQLVSN